MKKQVEKLSFQEEEKLVEDAKNGDSIAMEKLFKSYKRKIQSIVFMIPSYSRYNDFEDKIQLGYIGLLDAIKKYKPDRGACFRTYASIRIRGEILDGMRDNDPLSGSARSIANKIKNVKSYLANKGETNPTPEMIADELDISADKVREVIYSDFSVISGNFDYESWDVYTAPDFADKLTDVLSLSYYLSKLNAKELKAIELYFETDLSQKTIAEKLGVGKSRVSQLISKAIEKMQDAYYEDLMAEENGNKPMNIQSVAEPMCNNNLRLLPILNNNTYKLSPQHLDLAEQIDVRAQGNELVKQKSASF